MFNHYVGSSYCAMRVTDVNKAKKHNQMTSELPILETRKVLLEHLQAKIHPLCISASNENEVVLKITKNLIDSEIIRLLEDEVLLEEAVRPYVLKEEETLGELLFVAVASIDSELCAQITGMLLELDRKTIDGLLRNRKMLQEAVQKAKKEYLKFTKLQTDVTESQDQGNEVEDVGEVLYNKVLQQHPEPELAAQLTGMLLELEPLQLKTIVRDPLQLKLRLDKACKVLEKQQSA